MPELRAKSKMLVVHDDPAVVGTVVAALPDWWVGAVDHGDLAVADAAYVDLVLVDLEREPADGWFVLARLASEYAVVAIGHHRHASRALRLGAAVFATSYSALGGALSESRVA
jgi:CheY-like chemotaxis protein